MAKSDIKERYAELAIEWCTLSLGYKKVKQANRTFDKLAKVRREIMESEGPEAFTILIQSNNNCVRFSAAAALVATHRELAASVFRELQLLETSSNEFDVFVSWQSALMLEWGFPNS